MTEAFKKGFMSVLSKFAEEQPSPAGAAPATAGNAFNKLRGIAGSEGYEGLLSRIALTLGKGPLVGNYDAWDHAVDAGNEAKLNNSGVSDYGPLLSLLGSVRGMRADGNPDAERAISNFNASQVSPERWAAMTGAGTGPSK